MILFFDKNSKESQEAIEVLKEFENVKFVDISEAKNKELAKEYSVEKIPALILSSDDDISEEDILVGLDQIEAFLESEEEDF